MKQMDLSLTVQDWDTVVKWLRKLPVEAVEHIIAHIVSTYKSLANVKEVAVEQVEEVSSDEDEDETTPILLEELELDVNWKRTEFCWEREVSCLRRSEWCWFDDWTEFW